MHSIERITMNEDPDRIKQLGQFQTATIHEAIGKQGALPPTIKPISASMAVVGQVLTVDSMPGDNLLLHRAIAQANQGDVIVAKMSDYYEAGYWGELLTVAAMERGVAGLIIDACVRDADAIEALGFPVFCRGFCIRGTTKYGNGALNETIVIGDVTIAAGDVVVGDRDGVVIVTADRVQEAIEKSIARQEKEANTLMQLRSGKTTLEIYGWE
jgi:4-hydroxy-4-methyl-2-oxoglutarate aldolase